MRRALLLPLLALMGCSRQPSAEAVYADSWKAFRQGRLEDAQKAIDSALKNYRADESANVVLRLRLLKAESLLAQSGAPDARSLLDRLGDQKDATLHLRWLADQAEASAKLGDTGQALALLDDLDRAAASDSNDDSVLKGRLLRGAILARTGHLGPAEDLLRKTAAQAAGAGDGFNQAAALGNLSSCKIREDRFDESLEYSRIALEIAGKAQAGRLAAMAEDNLGIAYGALGDLDRAEQYQNRAIQQLREIGDLRNLADSFGAMGFLYLRRREPAKAVDPFEQAHQVAMSIHDLEEAGKWAGRVAYAMAAERDWNSAESWNQKASALYMQSGRQRPIFLMLTDAAVSTGRGNIADAEKVFRELIPAAKEGDPFVELNALLRFGRLLASDGRYQEANAQFDLGVASIERTVSALIRDDYRLTYYDLQNEFFKEYVDLLVTEKQEDQALKVAEYSRARVLAQKLGSRSSTIDRIQPANFQAYAKRNAAVLLSYWLGPRRSFVWVVKPSGIRMQELPAADAIRTLAQSYGKAIENLRDPLETGSPAGEQLSKLLLGPLQGDLAPHQRVMVVPDGELHALNFETLPVGDPGHYWIEDVELSVVPSLSLLAEASSSKPPQGGGSSPSLLLIGAAAAADPEYPELPAASAEIENIRHLFTGAEVHMGPDATPQSFLDSGAERFSLIHFAAHAEANPASPLDSSVILSRNKGDGGYKLYARDIANKKLSADLVTLSACRSAGARAYGGEGLVGFTWAFLEAGAHAVIAGLWEVGDESSARLMDKLYRGLAAGASPSAALREAKLALLRSGGRYRRPFYWAAYETYIR